MMQNRKYVNDLKEQDKVSEVYLCTRKTMPFDRNGRRYLNLTLTDKSGEIDALLWEEAERRSERFSAYDLVEVTGVVASFQSRKQLHLSDIRRATATGLVMEEFLHRSPLDPEQLWEELEEVLGTVQDPHLAGLINVYLKDPVFKRQLQLSPAAKSIHHAFMGGLLEHTLSVIKLTATICDHYQKTMPDLLNKDLALVGAFLHDLGKVGEISTEPGFQYTDQGRLLGHLVLGLQLLDKTISTLPDFPPEIALHLRHILISHHGKLEFGSPKRPKTCEAFVVHRADELDGHLGCLREVFSQNSTDGWTPYQPLFEQYFFYGWPNGGKKKKDEPTI